MEFKDYYKILGVAVDADAKEIKTAYRKLARKYHPDMNPDAGAEDKFKEVAEAYEVLKNPERRAEFDELRQYGSQSQGGFQPPPGWQGRAQAGSGAGAQFSGDFSDFFNSVFGGGSASSFQHGPGQQGARQQARRGQDVEIELPVFLEETLGDQSKSIEYLIPVVSEGTLREVKKHLKVKLPKGMTDGQRIRLKGQGAPGPTGEAGDLYLHIRLVPHPLFDVEGHNLILTLPLAPWEAALGAKVTVPTLDGHINLSISPNTPAGKKLRIKGKGLTGKTITGDLYAVIKIVMPDESDEKTQKLWRELSDTLTFDPRSEWSHAK